MGRALTPAQGDEFIAGVFRDGAGERRYKLFRPSAEKMPAAGQRTLVVVLHGCTQDADDIARGTRFNEAAARDGFVVLYPEQPESAHPRKCWNWYEPGQGHRGAGEAAIIANLTQKVAREEGIDPRQVYLAGISAGRGDGGEPRRRVSGDVRRGGVPFRTSGVRRETTSRLRSP